MTRAMAAKKKTNMKNEMIFKIVVMLVLLMISLVIVTFADSQGELKYRSYVVKAGDTLWGLADAAEGNMSITEIMQMIRDKNGIVGSTIYCGQIIEIPIFE